MISSKNVEKIYDILDIEDIISDFVTLKKRGSNLIGLCPFHDEKTPSFSVSPSKGIFKCFGCGKGGNAIHFLMEHENFTYPEALKYVAARYNIHIEEEIQSEEQQEEEKERQSLYIVSEFAKRFFSEQMFDTGEGQSVGLDYFKNRGYNKEIIEKFDLGYAPRSGSGLKRAALRAGHEAERLKKLGLLNSRESDFFRGRVMFTIHNLSGKAVGFAGRILGVDKKSPKYINSPESDIYNKSRILYGIYQARKAMRRDEKCYLVEGYTDVISMHQAGIENTVAVSGTSLTPGQIALIKRFASHVTLIFDGDTAGIKAANRSVDLLLEQEVNAHIVLLEEGEDPDSAVKSLGKEDFLTYVDEKAMDFLDFKIQSTPGAQSDDPFQRTKAVREIVGSLGLIRDQMNRSYYIRKTADIFKLDESIVVSEVNKVIKDKVWKEKGRQQRQARRENRKAQEADTSSPSKPGIDEATSPRDSVVQKDYHQELALVELLLRYGNELMEDHSPVHEFVFSNLEDVYEELSDPLVLKVLNHMRESIAEMGKIDMKGLVAHPSKEVGQLVVNLLTDEYTYSENWEERWNIVLQNQPPPEENFAKEAEEVVISLKLRKVRSVIQRQAAEIKAVQQEKPNEVNDMLEIYLELKELEKALASQLRTIVYG